MLTTINLSIGKTSEMSSKESFVQSMQTQWPSTDWNPQLISKRVTLCVKLRIWMEMSGLKLCEALASTCGLHRSLDGCLKFWRSGRSRRVWSRAEKKLKRGESELREVGC